jgi:hypothetical protein
VLVTRGWIVRALAALLVVAAAVAAAWWFFWTSPVQITGEGGFGIIVHSAVSGQPYSIGSIPLCEDDPSAVVDSVEVDDGGLRVTDFAVRARPEPPRLALGSLPQSLQSTGFGRDRAVTAPCDGESWSELGVEFQKATSATARTDVLLVHWSAGIRSGTVEVPMQLVLCAEGDDIDPDCADVP